jgi:CRISPR-associated endonuclease/helicase Cas3
MERRYAHSLEGRPPEFWQPLEAHLEGVADRAGRFAGPFASAEWGRILGVLHDVGKARESFQRYLVRSNGLSDESYDGADHSHSGAGAVWAVRSLPQGNAGRLLAYPVAGHHAGLPDWVGGEAPSGSLCIRLEQEAGIIQEPAVAEWIKAHASTCKINLPKPPWKFVEADVGFWLRMLHSCLVDADFLDTEAFMNPAANRRRTEYPGLAELADRFFEKLDAMQRNAAPTSVNEVRAGIRRVCETSADSPRGLFSLTVPTGGGKTLSGTAFAFRHALKHGMRRIIYVIPYTSIIEQTADTLRAFLGEANVVEHHSNFDPDEETQQSRLATENWDAPVVVTTNVQFFESLYACKSSRCRKLHNIADSVVILDEVQLLPPNLLLPCIEAMRQLTTHYGVSMVLSTATQPALPGLENIREIIPPAMKLYDRLRRTKIVIPEDLSARRSWEDLAAELAVHSQVLCVVNTRRDCRELYELMPEGTIHLSASMCGEHRSRVIAAIKAMLFAGLPIRVISTQLVEAGVDIDFPVVYRAFSGHASIAQAAGRCNREGKAPQPGRVVVFMPPKPAPLDSLRKQENAMQELLATQVDVEAPESFPLYFHLLYTKHVNLGAAFKGWLTDNAGDFQFQFREAAHAFRMIDDQASAAVFVRYGENEALLRSLLAAGPKRDIMRRLQRYTVNVPRRVLRSLLEKGFIEEPHPGLYLQTMPSLYREDIGLDYDHEGLAPEDLVI